MLTLHATLEALPDEIQRRTDDRRADANGHGSVVFPAGARHNFGRVGLSQRTNRPDEHERQDRNDANEELVFHTFCFL